MRSKTTNPQNFLITGPPGCGKSTVVESVVARINRPMTGFFTREIRERGIRRGFEIVTLDGQEGILARDDLRGSIKVGKYRVNLDDLERIAVPSMIPSDRHHVVVVDEIGKMECYSSLFRDTLVQALDSPNLVVATISLKGGSFIQRIKNRGDVSMYSVSENNRDVMPDILARRLQEFS